MATKKKLPLHPLAEVFGFPWNNLSREAERHRENRLCPFNNRVPSCTKDKAKDPLGVCSIYQEDCMTATITCPVRFRERWLIAQDAASFFFKEDTKWTSLTEVPISDGNGEAAGNIDVVLVAYDSHGHVTDFGALEVQGVYVSGNVRRPFDAYMGKRHIDPNIDWFGEKDCPRPDYLSSSRKRLIPQLLYKGRLLSWWDKKMAVAVHRSLFTTLPKVRSASVRTAELAWLVYDLTHQSDAKSFELTHYRSVYTSLQAVLKKMATPKPAKIEHFVRQLQERLDKQMSGNPPDAPILGETIDE